MRRIENHGPVASGVDLGIVRITGSVLASTQATEEAVSLLGQPP